MKQTIRLSREAERDLLALLRADRRFYHHVLHKVEQLADDPFSGKPLVGNHKGEYSLRVGDYRVVYTLHTGSKTVFVLTVKHRRHVY
ncbi:MAG: type II toxin-antitoxin system RelE/ParE family toxin [Candidatus Manganitrophaceae bacterium]